MEIKDHKKNREFLHAAYRDMSSAKDMFLAEPQLLHCRSSTGETPFHYLVVEGEIKRAEALLDWGSDINTQDDFGATPLIHAVTLGNLDLVTWLVQHGATLEPKNVSGETVLVYATSNEKREIFDFLISLPRLHPIDFYFDDLSAQEVFDNTELAMRNLLMTLGLTNRYA